MNPQIRYCTASDGVRIAYWTMGSGPALLHAPPGPFGHIAAELGLDDVRLWYERLARTHTLIRFDPRGCGASGRDGDVSVEAFALDFEAVCDALELDAFAIFAGLMWVPAAIAFAARVPHRLTHHVAGAGYARSSDRQHNSRLVATRTLIEQDWVGYTNAWAQTTFGWEHSSTAKAWARVFSEATTPEHQRGRMKVFQNCDVTEFLPQITAPVLVVDHRRRKSVLQEGAQFLAAHLPNARLVVLDGWQSPPSLQPDRVEENARLVDEFTGVPIPNQPTLDDVSPATPQAPAGTAIVLFTDIADSTALTERMGDAAFRAAARAIDDGVRATIRRHGGSPVEGKVLGDGVMGVFSSATQAINAARQCLALGEELPMHIGLHAGDVIREADNVYGGAVNIASRICGLCAPGEILVSATIRELARTSADVAFEDRGKQVLKGIEDPVRIFAVRDRH